MNLKYMKTEEYQSVMPGFCVFFVSQTFYAVHPYSDIIVGLLAKTATEITKVQHYDIVKLRENQT